jgi:site-specific recombinase XerD
MISRNVAMLVEPPRGPQHEIRPFDPEEARRFLTQIRGDRLEALYSVALALGLRQGEALGLQWRDVDLDRGLIRVVHQLQRVNSKLTLVSLKTDKSRRTLQLPGSTLRGLRDHHARQAAERRQFGDGWQDCDLVFTKPDGSPLEGSTVTRMFHRHLGDAGLPQRRFHDLRHSCATLLLVQGVSPRVVMEVLGHSDVSMTLNTYSHVVPQLRREAAARMEEILDLGRYRLVSTSNSPPHGSREPLPWLRPLAPKTNAVRLLQDCCTATESSRLMRSPKTDSVFKMECTQPYTIRTFSARSSASRRAEPTGRRRLALGPCCSSYQIVRDERSC